MKFTLLPVGNGDTFLLSEDRGRRVVILIDINLRQPSPGSRDADTRKQLRARLPRDARGRPYVHVFLLSHPDQDHCRGFADEFWLGDPADYPDDDRPDDEKRILVHELWSSPIVFRRASRHHVLCEDARAFASEARRRVAKNRKQKFDVVDGNRILILGEDEDGKTDDLGPILVRTGETFAKIAGLAHPHFQGTLLAPFAKSDDDDEEEVLTKNNSSVVMRITLTHSEKPSATAKLLLGGDAEVAICERLDAAYGATELGYDLLVTFHHCSWHTLSYDSISELGDKAKTSKAALRALSHACDRAHIVASSQGIVDDDCDPPSYRAKLEYEKLLKPVGGTFWCTGDSEQPLEFVVARSGGFERRDQQAAVRAAIASSAVLYRPYGGSTVRVPSRKRAVPRAELLASAGERRRNILRGVAKQLALHHPSLQLVGDCIVGDFPLVVGGKEFARFLLRILLPAGYPFQIPEVYVGDLPRTVEAHVFREGSACLFHPTMYWLERFDRRPITDFLNGPVRSYLLFQAARIAGVPWVAGELNHDRASSLAFFGELLDIGLEEVPGVMRALFSTNLRGHSLCPCGSGMQLQKCHPRVLRLIEVTPRSHLRAMLARWIADGN